MNNLNTINKNDNHSKASHQLIDKLLKIQLSGWDGTFIRQLSRWRDIALRDGKEFKLNQKQQAHLSRIASAYLTGGASHE